MSRLPYQVFTKRTVWSAKNVGLFNTLAQSVPPVWGVKVGLNKSTLNSENINVKYDAISKQNRSS